MITFITETDPDYAKRVYGLTFILLTVVLFALTLFTLFISGAFCVAAECVVIICMSLIAKKTLASNSHFNIRFEGKVLLAFGPTVKQEFTFDGLTRDDFVIKQNRNSEADNCCTLIVKGKRFYGVRKAKEIAEYIDRTF